MIFTPLPLTKVDNTIPLLEEAVVSMNASDRTNAKAMAERLKTRYMTRESDAYVDDVENPKHIIILERRECVVTTETMILVRLIYSSEGSRDSPTLVADFREALENYAKVFPCDTMVAASWVFRGSKDIGPMWKAMGFEPQETSYVKFL